MAITIGKVLDKAKADCFDFVADEYFDSVFVEVKMDHVLVGSRVIGEVIEKESQNPYFQNPTDIKYVDINDEKVSMRSLFVAKVKTLATIDADHKRIDVSFPPLPGTNVSKAKELDVKLALGLADTGMSIGILTGHNNLIFNISPGRLTRTHIAILGQTGSGKSYLAAKIVLELLKLRRFADIPSSIAVPIIFDSSGEYAGAYDIGTQNQMGLILPAINSKDHYFPLLNEKYLPLLYDVYELDEREESDLKQWLGSFSDAQIKEHPQGTLLENQNKRAKEFIEQFFQQKINSTKQLANSLEELIKTLNQLQGVERIPIPYKVLSKMRRLNLRVRKTTESDAIVDALGEGLIINLSDHENYTERQIALLIFLRQIYELAKKKSAGSKILVVIDEAHNYVPSVYKSLCKDEILRLAREGRKYGITLCLVSQRPRWVDPTALSQCGNIFIFRIQNSDDKKHIFDSASLPDSLRDANIAGLKTGDMIVAGDVVDCPIYCSVTQLDENFIENQRKEIAKRYIKEISGQISKEK